MWAYGNSQDFSSLYKMGNHVNLSACGDAVLINDVTWITNPLIRWEYRI